MASRKCYYSPLKIDVLSDRDKKMAREKSFAHYALAGAAVTGLTVGGIAIAEGIQAYREYEAGKEIDTWQKSTRKVLEGQRPSSQEFYDKVVTVAAGRNTLEEKIEMQQKGSRINVRDFAGTHTKNGEGTRVIGQIDQDIEIDGGMLVQGKAPLSPNQGTWFATLCRNIKGIIYNKGRSVTPPDNKVCAISADYVKKK